LWIRAAIHTYVLRSWSLVSVVPTVSQRRLFFKLRGIKGRIHAAEHGDMSPEDVERIAKELDVSAAEVVSMNRRLAGADYSLNASVGTFDDGGEWQDQLVDESDSQETELAERQDCQRRGRLLDEAVECLGPRERLIFVERHLSEKPRSLEQLSAVYGVSSNRVWQLEKKAMEKVTKAIKASLSRTKQRTMHDQAPGALRVSATGV
jgi:RNA polymerase sigma-32 factor